MRKVIIAITVVALLAVVADHSRTYAQVSANFKISSSGFTNGGGGASSTNFKLAASALGLPVEAKATSSANFSLNNFIVPGVTLPPVIALTADTDNNATAGSAKVIRATITSSASVTAKLWFMTGGKAFTSVDMTAAGNTFSGSIPATAVTLSGVAYYIKATDSTGQTADLPTGSSTDTKESTALNVTGNITGPETETNGSFAAATFPTWKVDADFRMVSFPVEIPNADPAVAFAGLGTVETDWQLYRFEGGVDYARAIAIARPVTATDSRGNIEKFASIQRGNAAWIYSANGGTVTVTGAKASNPLSSQSIKVLSGWNQIGNPFRFSRFWNNTVKFSTRADSSDAVDILAAAAANQLTPTIYVRKPGSTAYTKSSADSTVTGTGFTAFPGKFESWEGYWISIKATEGYLWIDGSVAGPASSSPSGAPIYNQIAQTKGWMLEMRAIKEQGSRGAEEQGIKTISVGMWDEAKEGEDNFDTPTPPFISADSLGFAIPHPEWNNRWARNYDQDIRAYKNSAYWEVEARSTDGSPVTLTWRELYRVPDNYMLYLVDPSADNKMVDIRKENSYTISADKDGKKLYVVATIDGLGLPDFLAKLLIKKTIAYQNYPNPFNPETWIPYQLSAAGDVGIRIFDVSGRLIRTLNLGRKEIGIYVDKDKAAYWDGRNDYGERVSSGIYFYELRAGKDFRAIKKMVILK